jgi:hypothetical protein
MPDWRSTKIRQNKLLADFANYPRTTKPTFSTQHCVHSSSRGELAHMLGGGFEHAGGQWAQKSTRNVLDAIANKLCRCGITC